MYTPCRILNAKLKARVASLLMALAICGLQFPEIYAAPQQNAVSNLPAPALKMFDSTYNAPFLRPAGATPGTFSFFLTYYL